MALPKPSDADREYFRSVLPDDPRVEVRPMFGSLGAFVNGNMFMGLFGSSVGVKLPEEAGTRLRELGGGPFGPQERPMKDYVALLPAWREAPEEAATWVDTSFAHISAWPEKVKKQRVSRKAKKAAED